VCARKSFIIDYASFSLPLHSSKLFVQLLWLREYRDVGWPHVCELSHWVIQTYIYVKLYPHVIYICQWLSPLVVVDSLSSSNRDRSDASYVEFSCNTCTH